MLSPVLTFDDTDRLSIRLIHPAPVGAGDVAGNLRVTLDGQRSIAVENTAATGGGIFRHRAVGDR